MLVDRLVALQAERKASDTAFAAFLGLSYATWRALKIKRIKPGVRTCRLVAQVLPDLKDLADAELDARAGVLVAS